MTCIQQAPATPDFISDWNRMDALYSVRFTLCKPVDGVAMMQCIWSPDVPSARAMTLLTAKYRAALAAFTATVRQAAFEAGAV